MNRSLKIKPLFSTLIMFVTALTLTLTVLLVASSLSVFNKDRFTQSLTDVQAVTRIAEVFTSEVTEIGWLYGVEAEVFDALDIEGFVEPIVYTEYPAAVSDNINLSAIRLTERLEVILDDFLLSQGLTLTNEVQEGIDELIREVEQSFRKFAVFPLHQNYFNLIQSFDKAFLSVLLIGCLILTEQLWVLYRLDHRKFRRNMAYVFLSGGWMLTLIPGGMLLSRFYRQILIYPDYFRDFLIRQIEVTLWTVLIGGLVLIACSLITFTFYVRKSSQQL